jgi:hypothetical protein
MRPVGPIPGQLIIAAASVALVFLIGTATLLLIVGCARLVRWVDRRSAARLLLEDLDFGLDELLQQPDIQEGLDRLRNAIGDEQQKGGTS